jgi:hypothetical protein
MNDGDLTLEHAPALQAASSDEIASVWKRRANAMMREESATADPLLRIPFLCECAGGRCYRTIWLAALEYDAQLGVQPLLVPGHSAPASGRA